MTDTIRWGILSTANIALKGFIPGVKASRNGTIAAIASRELDRAQSAASEHGIPKAYGSYEELLADPEIDAIYNPLPNALHAEWTIKAAAAGKPILCEKPISTNTADALRMIEACRYNDVLLMEAFMYRFHPQHARVHELIAAGAIGELRSVRASFSFLLEPFSRKNVRLQHDLGGGSLADVGCYAVNAARMLFGEEPLWASAQWDVREQFGVDVAAAGVLCFSDRRFASIDCGFRASTYGTYTAIGTKGHIDVPEAFVPDDDVVIVITEGRERREERLPKVHQFALEAEEFACALLAGRPVSIGPLDGVANLHVIDALARSATALGMRQDLRR